DLANASIITNTPSKELTQILSTIRSSTIITTTKTTVITKTINGAEATTSRSPAQRAPPQLLASSMSSTTSRSLSALCPLSVRSNVALGIQGGSNSALELTSGNLAVEHVAYVLSDLLFAYPSSVSQHSYLGHGPEQLAKAGLSPPDVDLSNALSAVLGAISSAAPRRPSVISALASSAVIVNMVPNLYQITQASRPIVFHVTAESVDSNLNVLRGDYSNVLIARETGLLYLASNSVQEAYDISVLLVLDDVQTSQQVEAIKTVSDQALAALVKQEQRNSVLVQDEESLISPIEGIFDRASALLKHSYKAIEYTGPKDVETIVAVPTSAKNVIVVEPVANTAAYDPIFLKCLAHLISAEDAQEFKDRVGETLTHADILREFPLLTLRYHS
ncbi:hypothetical protein BGX33_002876, partial [Mortierella sp. NVP41]